MKIKILKILLLTVVFLQKLNIVHASTFEKLKVFTTMRPSLTPPSNPDRLSSTQFLLGQHQDRKFAVFEIRHTRQVIPQIAFYHSYLKFVNLDDFDNVIEIYNPTPSNIGYVVQLLSNEEYVFVLTNIGYLQYYESFWDSGSINWKVELKYVLPSGLNVIYNSALIYDANHLLTVQERNTGSQIYFGLFQIEVDLPPYTGYYGVNHLYQIPISVKGFTETIQVGEGKKIKDTSKFFFYVSLKIGTDPIIHHLCIYEVPLTQPNPVFSPLKTIDLTEKIQIIESELNPNYLGYLINTQTFLEFDLEGNQTNNYGDLQFISPPVGYLDQFDASPVYIKGANKVLATGAKNYIRFWDFKQKKEIDLIQLETPNEESQAVKIDNFGELTE